MRHRWLLAVAALLLVGCGGGPSDTASGAGDVAPPAAEPQADSEENPSQAVQPFDPDAADLARLIFWDERDSLVLVEIPDKQQELFDRLLASDDPAIDKYLVDLGAFPNAYRLQVIDYLRARFETVPFNFVYNFPEIFELDPADTDTDGYVEFKTRAYRRASFGDGGVHRAELRAHDRRA